VSPIYAQNSSQVSLLIDLLESIRNQSYKNFEVILCDHSTLDFLEDEVGNWQQEMDITYMRNERSRGNSSANMNEGIKLATGDFIKIMHMDDFFCNDRALEILARHLSQHSATRWGAFTFNHYYMNENSTRRQIKPSMTTTMGCPSTSFFFNDSAHPPRFDENLIFINDHDMHQRLFAQYGAPLIIDDLCITIRMHDVQISSWLDEETKNSEWEYFNKKVMRDE
jgi:glycosyltransferase involved in cell wall biosynthesis